MATDKLLLCRPLGGLNDTLAQIEACCRYAERTNRTVIVDTNYPHTHYPRYFGDDFSNYFSSRHARLILDAASSRDCFDRADVFPAFIAGGVNSYRDGWSQAQKKHVHAQRNRPVGFDFSKDYPQQLLVHHQSGGSEISLFALLRLKLRDSIIDELLARLRRIGTPYTAIHVRHTDYQTNYDPAIASLRTTLKGNLFVATDNDKVVAHFREALGDDRVFSFASLPAAWDAPARGTKLSATAVFERNRDTIVDLLMLGLSSRLRILELEPNPIGAKYSGYSKLARNLWASKVIIKHLTADSRLVFGLD